MPEPHSCPEFQQPGLGRRRRRLNRDSEPCGRLPHQARVADRIGRCQQQQPPGLGRQGLRPAAEALLDPPRQRYRAGQPEPARQFRQGQPPRQLQQRQRVAPRLGDDLITDPLIERRREHRIQQRPGIVIPQARQHQLRQPRSLVARRARREDQAHRLRRQPARHEPEYLRGGAVEPLLVVHQADQRSFPGHVGQQAQHGQADQEPVRRRAGPYAERDPQRITLRNRQPFGIIQHRRAHLLQPGERQLHLRLDAGGTHHPAVRRLPGDVVQQRRLAHARLADHHQRPALTRPDGIDQPVQHAAFAAPARQPCRASWDGGVCRHLTDTKRRRAVTCSGRSWSCIRGKARYALDSIYRTTSSSPFVCTPRPGSSQALMIAPPGRCSHCGQPPSALAATRA